MSFEFLGLKPLHQELNQRSYFLRLACLNGYLMFLKPTNDRISFSLFPVKENMELIGFGVQFPRRDPLKIVLY